MRLLHFEPLDWFLVAGDLRELKDPDGRPTIRQWRYLNRLGCIVLVEPGGAVPLDRQHAVGAIAAALAVGDTRGEASR